MMVEKGRRAGKASVTIEDKPAYKRVSIGYRSACSTRSLCWQDSSPVTGEESTDYARPVLLPGS